MMPRRASSRSSVTSFTSPTMMSLAPAEARQQHIDGCEQRLGLERGFEDQQIRRIDLGQVVAAPNAAARIADLGARQQGFAGELLGRCRQRCDPSSHEC